MVLSFLQRDGIGGGGSGTAHPLPPPAWKKCLQLEVTGVLLVAAWAKEVIKGTAKGKAEGQGLGWGRGSSMEDLENATDLPVFKCSLFPTFPNHQHRPTSSAGPPPPSSSAAIESTQGIRIRSRTG